MRHSCTQSACTAEVRQRASFPPFAGAVCRALLQHHAQRFVTCVIRCPLQPSTRSWELHVRFMRVKHAVLHVWACFRFAVHWALQTMAGVCTILSAPPSTPSARKQEQQKS